MKRAEISLFTFLTPEEQTHPLKPSHKGDKEQGVVVYSNNPRTWEVEARRS
jgi:hypothetical protein